MFPSPQEIAYQKEQFPKGTRVKLLRMNDLYAPPVGTLGTVMNVDDIGSLLVHWDNGSSLHLLCGEDSCAKVTRGMTQKEKEKIGTRQHALQNLAECLQLESLELQQTLTSLERELSPKEKARLSQVLETTIKLLTKVRNQVQK